MTRDVISTDTAPAAIGPYSQGIRATGTLLFLSGSIPLRPDGSTVEGDVKVQAEQVMHNIGELLQATGADFKNVVKTTIFLSDMAHFGTVNEVYGAYFPVDPPARSTVAVAGLPRGFDVEIEVTAVL